MNAADFQLNVSLPADARFASTMRDLATHAAKYAGCADPEAARYGAAVERVVIACVDAIRSGGDVAVILRRGAGPLECLIACERRPDAPANDGHITVGWTDEHGASMCRVALEL